jgi:hypothetical protein
LSNAESNKLEEHIESNSLTKPIASESSLIDENSFNQNSSSKNKKSNERNKARNKPSLVLMEKNDE